MILLNHSENIITEYYIHDLLASLTHTYQDMISMRIHQFWAIKSNIESFEYGDRPSIVNLSKFEIWDQIREDLISVR